MQDIIIGNIPGALGAEVSCNHDDSIESVSDLEPVNGEVTMICDKSNSVTGDHRDQINTPEEQTVISDEQLIDHTQTRAMVARESKPPKPLKVKSMPGLDIGPDELKVKQKADPTLRKYWELADKSVDGAKQQFFTKKGILYCRYCGKQNTDKFIQLVVPNELREKVVSLAHDTLLAIHRGTGETLTRVQQKFYWPGIREYVTRYVTSCDLCQRNVSKGTVAKASMEDEDPEVKTAYQNVTDFRERVEETCELARNELAKVQARNLKYYNRRARERKLNIGESVLLLLPTERNKLTLAWRGPYKVVGIVGEVDYRIEMDNGKVKTYHINMLKRYFHRENKADSTAGNRNKPDQVCDEQVHQAASVACVIEDEEIAEGMTVNDAEILPLYNLKQKETVKTL